MRHGELERIFRQTLDDRRLSRGERQGLAALVAELDPGTEERAAYLGRAFEAAAGAMSRHTDREVLDWLLAVTKTVTLAPAPGSTEVAEALFGPRQNCAERLRSLIAESAASIDVCVYTFTDNSLARAILAAHGRGLKVRLITDDEKSLDPGSDVFPLRDAGVAVRFDASLDHMHHKFAVFDRRLVVTGSYNWTRSAAENNHENILITGQARLVQAFHDEFERLWAVFPVQPSTENV
jgi:phosphatidylserine/phosphatidylglycerophosphate/cardiolipin synthase-like enzyme